MRARFGAALLEPVGSLRFRLEVPVSIAVRGLPVERKVLIEPRFTSIIEDRIYFTVSPLPSIEHLEMVTQLVARSSG